MLGYPSGYPYGWGLQKVPTPDDLPEKHKAVKEVKDVKTIKKECERKKTAKEHPFLWGVHHVTDLDEICFGLE